MINPAAEAVSLVGAHFEPVPAWKGRVRVVAEDHPDDDNVIVTRVDSTHPRRVRRSRLLSRHYRLRRGVPERTTGGWLRYPPVADAPRGCCLNCDAGRTVELAMDDNPHPGFGVLALYRDDLILAAVGADDTGPSREQAVEAFRVAEFERIAAAGPDGDWQIHVYGATDTVIYQRHGTRRWVCIEKAMAL